MFVGYWFLKPFRMMFVIPTLRQKIVSLTII